MANFANASILATEVRTIRSRNVEQEYSVSVALPYSYTSKSRRDYPVIYLTDANLYFGMVTDMTRAMHLCGRFPETIVVGIGYPMDEPIKEAFKQFWARRSRDLTPNVDRKTEKELAADLKLKAVRTGGADNFLAFIKDELMPTIETDYRARPNHRILAGHSFGGLFTLYALFRQPRLFTGYVACSPSLWYGNKTMFMYEESFAKRHRQLPVKLYVGIGGLEEGIKSQMVSDVYRFAALISSRKYKGLSLTKQIVENCDHCAASAPTFQAGLQAVLI